MTAVIAVPYGHDFNEMFCEAFEELGWNATSVFYYHRGSRPGVANLAGRVGALLRGADRTFQVEKRKCLDWLFRVIDKNQPRALLVIRGEWLDREAMEKIRRLSPGIKIAVWIYDPIEQYHQGLDATLVADRVYLYDIDDIERYGARTGRQAERLDLAHSAARLRPLSCSQDIDVSMTGSFGFGSYGKRLETAAALARIGERLGIKVNVVGACWTAWTPGAVALRRTMTDRFPELARVFTNRRLSYPMQNELYNRSKINVNVHRDESTRSSNTRVFEILGAGAFQLCDHNAVVMENFTPGVHLDVFRTVTDLEERIRYYLDNADERKRIASAGHDHVRTHHQFKHRAARVLSDLGLGGAAEEVGPS